MMFRDAAEIMGETPEDCHRSHVTGLRWKGFEPILTERIISTGEERRLRLEPLDIFVSEARRCVGARDGGPCHSQIEPRMSLCRSCDPFPVQECRFHPRCRGTMCDGTVCGEPHVVYLAIFADQVKVGMTRLSRLRERGIEQGADIIVPLQEHPNRQEARRAEQALSKDRGLPQAMSLSVLASCLDDDAAEKAAMRWEELSGSMGPGVEPILLDSYPLNGLVGVPKVMPTAGKHRGELMGCKGRLAVYRDEIGMLKALDMKDLVSRFLGTAPSRCAQSTLF